MSDLLGIGASGISAYRAALSAVSDNVVNAETEGFSRRTVTTRQSAASVSSNPLYRTGITFGGVETAGVGRAWDAFTAAEARISASDNGRADARMRWLSTAETALDDSSYGAGAKVTAFYTAADALAGNPSDTMSRNAMLAALDDAAGAIRTSADGLARVSAGIATETQSDVEGANSDLTALAKINLSIKRSAPGSSARATLLDERDRLVDNIASRVAVDVSYDGDGGAVLTLAGNNGQTLLSGTTAAHLSMQQAADGRVSVSATFEGSTQPINPTGGSLAGLVDSAATIAGRRTQLDSIAVDFAATINGWQANGRTEAGAAGVPLLTIAGGAATLKLATDDPAAIAAASASGVANGNLLALQTLRSGGTETRLANLVAGHSQAVASAKSEAAAAATRMGSAYASLDSVTGIDLDREAAELIRYQQAYDASSKIVQVARETLQTIIDLF